MGRDVGLQVLSYRNSMSTVTSRFHPTAGLYGKGESVGT